MVSGIGIGMGRIRARFERMVEISVRDEVVWIFVAVWIEVQCVLVYGNDRVRWDEVVLVHNIGCGVMRASDTIKRFSI